MGTMPGVLMPHFSDQMLVVVIPFGIAIVFLLWFLWNLTRQTKR